MFTIWGAKQRLCDGTTRRNFLKIGAALGAGLSLADVLRLRAGSDSTVSSSTKSAIMIDLPGGPSHIDTYDLKPNAPVEYRGEFKPIKTNVSGVDICELFPLQAQMWDKLACIRSLIGDNTGHSTVQNHTGFKELVNKVEESPVARLRRVKTAQRRHHRRAAVRPDLFAATHSISPTSRATSASRTGHSPLPALP